MGLVFAFSGLVKAIDPLGTVYKVEDYLKAFGGIWTELMFLAPVAAYGLILAEIVLAGALIAGYRQRICSWLTLLFYAVMTPLTLWIALTDPVSDCGCFGDALVLTNWQTFWKNVVLLSLTAGWIITLPREEYRHQLVRAAGIGVMLLLSCLPIRQATQQLPLIDFRPYKVGNHIPTLMEVPEDAPQPIYETTFIYADSQGHKREFTLENYPKGDPEWTFVDQKSRLIQKGYEAPIHDFEIMTEDYEDITWDILETEDLVTLCIMYDITKSAPAKRQAIEELAAKSDIFYVVTGSSEEDIEAYGFSDDIEVCTCDPVTLKTIVRANPGIVEIQNGVITEKYRL